MNALKLYATACFLACLLLYAALVLQDLLRRKVTSRDIPRQNGRPYLKRFGWGPQTIEQSRKDEEKGKSRVRLHHFVGPDDAGHHNHPFKWSFSIVLRGSYTEEVLDLCPGPQCSTASMSIRTRRVRWFNWIPQGKYHRITELHGDVWTLFFMGPRVSSWGFWVPGRGHVPWRQYNQENARTPEET